MICKVNFFISKYCANILYFFIIYKTLLINIVQLIKKYKSEAKTKGSNADTYLDLAVKENKRNIESQKRIQEMEKENLELRRFISNNGLSKNVDGGKIQEDIQGSGGEKLSASNNDF